MEIKIREVKPEDAERYVNLVNVVWRDAYKHIFPEEVFVERESRAQDMIKTFPQFIYHSGDQLCYVAEDNKKIVGFILGQTKARYEFSEFAELMAIYILPEYQGKGIGSKFKTLFVDWAKNKGAKKFVVGVLKDNHKARKVYEKWGGKLATQTRPFVKLGVDYEEVFYIYEI